ncbi:MAG: hypothetical protein PHV59_12680 [Victivallales bacterium]|nr:hypothetical protein [Victivallales bacterium]
MPEFYLDERPSGDEGSSQWGGSGGSVDPWGASWGSDGDSGEQSEPDQDQWHVLSSWNHSQTEVLLNGDGYLQGCGPWVLKGSNGCLELIVKAQIDGDDSGYHARCILFSFTMSERSGETNDPYEWLFGNIPVLNGTMTLRAKWQAGHWDYEKIHTVRFKIMMSEDDEDGVITPWVKLPLGSPYVDIANIDIVHGQLIINSLRLVS